MNEICIKAGEENAVSLISLENLSVLISSDTTLIYPACTLVWMYAIAGNIPNEVVVCANL